MDILEESPERKKPGIDLAGLGASSDTAGFAFTEMVLLVEELEPWTSERYAARVPLASVISRSQSDFPVDITT